MQLEQQFTIPTDLESAWKLMNDVEGIAPCFPGAKVISATDESVEGQVKVKLGPVMLTYAGVLKFLERDEIHHRLVMDGQGVDAKGNGSASAKVTAQLTEVGDGITRCDMVTDLNVTGRPAQFGRGMMLDIGNNILGKFATNLASMLSAQQTDEVPKGAAEAAADAHAAPISAPSAGLPDASPQDALEQPTVARRGVRKAARLDYEDSLDLLSAAGAATAKRLLPVLIGAAVAVGVVIWIFVK